MINSNKDSNQIYNKLNVESSMLRNHNFDMNQELIIEDLPLNETIKSPDVKTKVKKKYT